MSNLSDHDLKQMDPTWQQRQPEETVRGLLARALDDLRQARDRLKQDPTNSSRPSGSMEPWRGGGEAEAEVSASQDAASSDSPRGKAEDDQPGARAASSPKAGEASPAPRGPGKPAGAAGFGRTQRLAATETERHRPLHCAACGQPLDAQAPCSAWTGWNRTAEMFDNALGAAFAGVLMSDGYSVYRARADRLRCWAHLLRKLRGLAESTDCRVAGAGGAMLGHFERLKTAIYAARGADPPGPAPAAAPWPA